MSSMNAALQRIPKRAERSQAEQLRNTFVDSGVEGLLDSVDHQVVYGRRGTGKTHALRFLEGLARQRGDLPIYTDLRTIGSPGSLFMGRELKATERAVRLMVDLLTEVHEQLTVAAVEDDELIRNGAFLRYLDDLGAAFTAVRVAGPVEATTEKEDGRSSKSSASAGATIAERPGFEFKLGVEDNASERRVQRETRRGDEQFIFNVGDITRALRNIEAALRPRRVLLLLDEWSSIPADVQPLLGEFLTRCVLPLAAYTVKIAAIEQQTRFRAELEDHGTVGFELGADVMANVNLDDFMVFESNEERARSFFRRLFFKHLSQRDEERRTSVSALVSDADVIRQGFTDKRAFDELVRAAEGVPRDIINVAAKAAFMAGESKISVENVQTAARSWYQTDKEGALREHEESLALMNWIVDETIRGKKARGFLVSQRDTNHPLLLSLFDARMLHVVRRGYSAQDVASERYDVWVIDYGAYIHLVHTKSAPRGLLPFDDQGEVFVEVPTQDLRSLRRALLDLSQFGVRRNEEAMQRQAEEEVSNRLF